MAHSSIALALLLAMAAPSGKPLSARQRALGAVASSYSDVSWYIERALDVELTDDGESDLAVPGRRGEDFAVAVVIGPIGPQSQILRMMWLRAGAEGARDCARGSTAALVAERPALPADLWGCVQDAADEFCIGVRNREAWLHQATVRGMRGLRVSGDAGCTEVHLYWNPDAKQFDQ